MLTIWGLFIGTILKGKTMDEVACKSILSFIDVLPFFDGVLCPFGYQWMGLTNTEAIQ
jgi:hypothetical protein